MVGVALGQQTFGHPERRHDMSMLPLRLLLRLLPSKVVTSLCRRLSGCRGNMIRNAVALETAAR